MRTTRLNVLAATFAALLPGTASLGTEITPQALLERVAGTYASLQTYRSEGTIASAIETGGVTTSVSTSFTILLKKPNLYRVTWSQAYAIPPGLAQAGAVWRSLHRAFALPLRVDGTLRSALPAQQPGA